SFPQMSLAKPGHASSAKSRNLKIRCWWAIGQIRPVNTRAASAAPLCSLIRKHRYFLCWLLRRCIESFDSAVQLGFENITIARGDDDVSEQSAMSPDDQRSMTWVQCAPPVFGPAIAATFRDGSNITEPDPAQDDAEQRNFQMALSDMIVNPCDQPSKNKQKQQQP